MAWTQSDLDAVETALAKGEKTVAFADRSVTYRSAGELLTVRAAIEGTLAGRPKQTLIVAAKGFDSKGF